MFKQIACQIDRNNTGLSPEKFKVETYKALFNYKGEFLVDGEPSKLTIGHCFQNNEQFSKNFVDQLNAIMVRHF